MEPLKKLPPVTASPRQPPLGGGLNAAVSYEASLCEGGGIAQAMPEGVLQQLQK